jgi:zinc protease
MTRSTKSIFLFFILILIPFCEVIAKKPHFAIFDLKEWASNKKTPVYWVQTKTLPMVDIHLLFRAGSSADKTKHGLAKLTSSMIFLQAQGLRKGSIARELEMVGAQYAVKVGRDFSDIHLRSLTDASNLTTSLNILKKVIQGSVFDQSDFLLRQEMLITENKAKDQDPAQKAFAVFYEKLYGRLHGYATPVTGKQAVIKTLTVQDVRNFYKHRYIDSPPVIVMVGDLSFDKAHEVANALSAVFPVGFKKIEHASHLRKNKDHGVYKQAFDSKQTSIVMGTMGISRNDPDYYALLVGNQILGGGSGLTSLLGQRIRGEKGYVYSVYSGFSFLSQGGPFWTFLQTKNGHANEALHLVRETVQQFIAQGPTPKALRRAKNAISGDFLLTESSNKGITKHAILLATQGLHVDFYKRFLRGVEKTSAQSIQLAFDRFLRDKPLLTVMVGGGVN